MHFVLLCITKNHEKDTVNKTLSKYIAAFNYVDKTLPVLSATSGGVYITLVTTA